MEIPIELRINLKPGLSLMVKICSNASKDTDQLKLLSSLLADVAIVVDRWQAANGSYGVSMPKPMNVSPTC